jgi:hypothetical protein
VSSFSRRLRHKPSRQPREVLLLVASNLDTATAQTRAPPRKARLGRDSLLNKSTVQQFKIA